MTNKIIKCFSLFVLASAALYLASCGDSSNDDVLTFPNNAVMQDPQYMRDDVVKSRDTGSIDTSWDDADSSDDASSGGGDTEGGEDTGAQEYFEELLFRDDFMGTSLSDDWKEAHGIIVMGGSLIVDVNESGEALLDKEYPGTGVVISIAPGAMSEEEGTSIGLIARAESLTSDSDYRGSLVKSGGSWQLKIERHGADGSSYGKVLDVNASQIIGGVLSLTIYEKYLELSFNDKDRNQLGAAQLWEPAHIEAGSYGFTIAGPTNGAVSADYFEIKRIGYK